MWRSCVGVVLKRIKRHCWFIKMIKSTNISQVTLKVTAFIQKLTTSFTWLAINQFWPYHAKKRSPSLFLTIWCRNMLLKEEKPRKAILHYKILTLYPIKRKREKNIVHLPEMDYMTLFDRWSSTMAGWSAIWYTSLFSQFMTSKILTLTQQGGIGFFCYEVIRSRWKWRKKITIRIFSWWAWQAVSLTHISGPQFKMLP